MSKLQKLDPNFFDPMVNGPKTFWSNGILTQGMSKIQKLDPKFLDPMVNGPK